MGNLYETDKLLEEYLLLHYGTPEQIFPWSFGPREALEFPRRCVSERLRPPKSGRALELGCAVGRACFELSIDHSEVIGIDYSKSFIEQARQLVREREVRFSSADEGDLLCEHHYRLEDRFHPERVQFEVGDATNLRTDLGEFEVVMACNLLCRVPYPQAVLARFPELVKKGGQLLITSPYTWMTEYTPRRFWLGGFERKGEAVRSLDSIKKALADSFELDEVVDMPFLIREHSRKFQWGVSQASLWIRR
ncbi:MAG: putative 4-mercaptohistidine N1-methyltransferase [Vulcanimicrobiota bacterium]